MCSVSSWWIALSPEVQAAFIGAGATAGAAIFGVLAVIAQIRSQGRQSRATIAEGERRKINAALYEDAVTVCRALADAAIELSTKLRTMNFEVEIAAHAEEANLTYNLPSARFPTISGLYNAFSDAALRFIFLIENRRIVDPRILIFRTAMSVVLHDSRQLAFSDFVLHVMPALPTEKPEGGLFPYRPPPIEGALTVARLSNRLIDALDDSIAYTDDFLTEMQNALLGDLFETKLYPRQPLDPDRRAITLGSADHLEKWFRANSAWGIATAKAEADARFRLVADGDGRG